MSYPLAEIIVPPIITWLKKLCCPCFHDLLHHQSQLLNPSLTRQIISLILLSNISPCPLGISALWGALVIRCKSRLFINVPLKKRLPFSILEENLESSFEASWCMIYVLTNPII